MKVIALKILSLVLVAVPVFATENLSILSCFYEKYEGTWEYTLGLRDAERTNLLEGQEIFPAGGFAEGDDYYILGRTIGSSRPNRVVEGAEVRCGQTKQTFKKEIANGEAAAFVSHECGLARVAYVATEQEARILDNYESQEASDLLDQVCEKLKPSE